MVGDGGGGKIVGIGPALVDLVAVMDCFPPPNASVQAQSLGWQGGGKIATGLVAAARLGMHCAIQGARGDDAYGRYCVADFRHHGVDCTRLYVRSDRSTCFSIVISNRQTNGRCIISRRENEARDMEAAEVDEEQIAGAGLLYLCYTDDASRQALAYAKRHGVATFFDGDRVTEDMRRILPDIDVFVGSEFAYRSLFGSEDFERNCAGTMALGPKIVVFTLGERGCIGMDRNGFFSIPAFPVEVVDTLGAGDVFHGAFAAGLLHGFSAKEAARFASAAAAIKCTMPGGRAGIPDYAAVMRFLETGRIDRAELEARREWYAQGLAIME